MKHALPHRLIAVPPKSVKKFPFKTIFALDYLPKMMIVVVRTISFDRSDSNDQIWSIRFEWSDFMD